jgi:hypothetical protein
LRRETKRYPQRTNTQDTSLPEIEKQMRKGVKKATHSLEIDQRRQAKMLDMESFHGWSFEENKYNTLLKITIVALGENTSDFCRPRKSSCH